MFDTIAKAAEAESTLWADALVPGAADRARPVFSQLGPEELRLGVETIYEGYLVHYGRSRLFAPPDDDTALLLGDYLYAHGLVRVAETGDVAAVGELAELISLCAQARAEGVRGDDSAWAATAALLGVGGLEEAREALRVRGDHRPLDDAARRSSDPDALERALETHADLVG